MGEQRRICLALSVGAALLLAGCGGLQSLIGAPAPIPKTSAIAARAERGTSWMLPEAKGDDLLYVSKLKNVIVFAYPSHKVVGNLTGFDYASGLCSDRGGNVWVTDLQKLQITEYAHAGTKPIAQLSDGNDPVGCAVDPLSGDLAAANYEDNVSVYPHAGGNPVIYTAPDFYFMEFCSYDGSGNLFIDGYRGHRGFGRPSILKLSYGSAQLQRFKLEGRRKSLQSAGALQWDGKSLVVGFAGPYGNLLYRVSDLGSTGKITRRIELVAPGGGFIPGDAPFVLYKGYVTGRYDVGTTQISNVAIWPYPRGGSAVKDFKVRGRFFPAGIALSVRPK